MTASTLRHRISKPAVTQNEGANRPAQLPISFSYFSRQFGTIRETNTTIELPHLTAHHDYGRADDRAAARIEDVAQTAATATRWRYLFGYVAQLVHN